MPTFFGGSVVTGITIGGGSVSIPGTIVPDRWVVYVRGGIPSLSFSVRGGPLPTSLPDPYLNAEIQLKISGTLYYKGDVLSVGYAMDGRLGWVRKYQSLGIRNRGDYFPHTDSNNGSDTSAYNLQADNQAPDYLASRAGRNTGQILTDVLTMVGNATAANGYGLGAYTSLGPPTLPAATVSDLAAMTIIPQAPVYFGGERYLSAIDSFVSTYAPNYCFWVMPDGTFRFLDLRAFTAHTLTMDAVPPTIYPSEITRDITNCFTRVLVRGTKIAEMFSFSTLGPSGQNLSEAPFAHDGLTVTGAKAVWTPLDYYNSDIPPGQAGGTAAISGAHVVTGVTVVIPGYGYTVAPAVVFQGGGGGSGATATATISGGIVTGVTITAGGSGYTVAPIVVFASPNGSGEDRGTCTCPSTTTVTLTSSNPGMSWVAGYWDQTSTGREGTIYLAYSVGTGVTTYAQRKIVTCPSLSASGACTITVDRALPITLYDSYYIRGLAKTSAAVWCNYGLPSWAGPIAAKQSTYPFAYIASGGLGITDTSGPMGIVIYPSNGLTGEIAYPIQVYPALNLVQFAYPTFVAAGNQVPVEVRALIPIYTDSNEAYAPSSSTWSGTAFTVEGVERQLTVTVSAWRDPANLTALQALASDILDSVSNTVLEGTVKLLNLDTTYLSMGTAINIAGTGYTTGWESGTVPAMPVLECQVTWPIAGDLDHEMVLSCSSRKAHMDAAVFLKPDRTGLNWDFGVLDPRYADPGYPSTPARTSVAPGLDAPVAMPRAGLNPVVPFAPPSGLAPPTPFPEAGF